MYKMLILSLRVSISIINRCLKFRFIDMFKIDFQNILPISSVKQNINSFICVYQCCRMVSKIEFTILQPLLKNDEFTFFSQLLK